ncbi:AAA family ATPase [Actinacidiphila glaucinigra]|uniref:AAA family ATPase n=1 Tax=Actinacidiphila glaucinigra TaxID=235986 RepID=UPI002DD91D10|nr:AAA family ATPase [Actinacidiphila glaucinigra]WSD59244.1 AAA family ATPase [Actinacidiphila glaucinigra]
MNAPDDLAAGILPFSRIVGQDSLKLALELAFVAPAINGVLVSGERGTAKSTLVRAFSLMAHGQLPVTLPINATDDRVLGGWDIDALMDSRAVKRAGLIEEAGRAGMLYIDEVNLLDDHIVNILLDVAAAGILLVEREGQETRTPVSFVLLGTMNPEEGWLRPQLLDRFGLMAAVDSLEPDQRHRMVMTVLRFDEERASERAGERSAWLEEARALDRERAEALRKARSAFSSVHLPEDLTRRTVEAVTALGALGHRGEVAALKAAKAHAALDGAHEVTGRHIRKVLPMALSHRRADDDQTGVRLWSEEDEVVLADLFEE